MALRFGILAYGAALFFLVHDIFIQPKVQTVSETLIIGMQKGTEGTQDAPQTFRKRDGECFGMLLVHLIFSKKEKSHVELASTTLPIRPSISSLSTTISNSQPCLGYIILTVP